MKKLSLLVATLLIATIGGVYAAFIYPSQTGAAKGEVNRSIYLEQATQFRSRHHRRIRSV